MPKSFFTYDQQIVKLETKRLDIADKQAATEKLQQCSYYALIGGYKQIFKDPTTRDYLPGTKFEDIVALYRFDEALREIALNLLKTN